MPWVFTVTLDGGTCYLHQEPDDYDDSCTYTVDGELIVFSGSGGSVSEFTFTRDADGTLHLQPPGWMPDGDAFVTAALGADRLTRPRVSDRLVAERKLGDEPRSDVAGDLERSAESLDTVHEVAQPRAGGGISTTDAVVADLDGDSCVDNSHGNRRLRRRGVLGDVGQPLRADEVHRRLDRRRQTLLAAHERNRRRATCYQHRERDAEPGLAQQAWMEAGGQCPQLLEGRGELFGDFRDCRFIDAAETPGDEFEAALGTRPKPLLKSSVFLVACGDDSSP